MSSVGAMAPTSVIPTTDVSALLRPAAASSSRACALSMTLTWRAGKAEGDAPPAQCRRDLRRMDDCKFSRVLVAG